MDPFTGALIASVIGGGLSAAGSVAGAKAQSDASKDVAASNERIYQDQARRNEPWRQAGINALNFQNQWLGMPGVADSGGGISAANHGQSDQWSAYLTANPDVYDYWKSNAKLREMYPLANDFAAYHYANFGQQEGRPLPSPSGDKSNQPVGGAQEVGQTGQVASTDIWDTIKKNPLWAAATEGFIKLDTPEVNAAYATGGKVMSGAQKKALHDRSTARSYNALGDIYNQYAGVSGTGYTATQATNQAQQNMGANTGNAIMARGNAQASGYAGIANGIGAGISGAADAYFRYGGGGGGSSYGGFKNRY